MDIVVAKLVVFLAESWGEIASVVGAILTVIFSWSASSSSKKARIATEQTRQKLQTVDHLTEANRLLNRVDDLLFRLENNSWELSVERATDLRVSIAAMLSHVTIGLSDETKQRLGEAVAQFKNIASAADRAAQDGGKIPDTLRSRRIVTDQKETLVLAISELKILVGEVE